MSYSTAPPPPPPSEPPPPAAPPPPPPAYRPPRRRRSGWLLGCGIALAVVVVGLIVLVAVVAAVALTRGEGGGLGSKVALIKIEGVITAGPSGGGLLGGGQTGSARIVDLIRSAERDSGVKAIVLRINSPGGSAAGSQEIYQALMRAREAKPVVVSMGDVAASGGYYIASAADVIVANGSSLTGSIGVIWSSMELDELFKHIGIRGQVIKSGKYKDIGSSLRPMTEDERRLIQAVINDVFDQFVEDVAKGRKMPREQVRKLADGRIFTGRQAKTYKLVDQVGSQGDAVRVATRRAGIPADSRVVEFGKRSPLQYLLGETETSARQRLLGRLLYDPIAERLAESLAAP